MDPTFSDLLLFSFKVGSYLFAIPTVNVLELSKSIEVTVVPGAPSYINGLINLRGDLVISINMHKRLGIESNNNSEKMCIYMQTENNNLGLLVDDVCEMYSFKPERMERPLSTDEMSSGLIVGGYQLKDKLLFVLECEKILTSNKEMSAESLQLLKN